MTDSLRPYSLANHFLIAMPSLEDSFFADSVVFLCDHTADGAMGVVINKPSPLTMDIIFDGAKLPTPTRFHGKQVLIGGPVQLDHGFLLHSPAGSWDSSFLVAEDMALTASRDIVTGLTLDDKVDKALVTLGLSSWAPGQLEKELAENAWLAAPADRRIIFDLPYEERYQAAIKLLHVSPAQLIGSGGHA
ncbi:YqgE/AlgH family protein [Stenoxybacter acetivorans]|uniref:YqgE/AlgH family protein n=1 Tax=Stenoxybacter acetivorans TaxID=422441 RepID=UPI00056BA4C0|nr:YqgE/AlgH family protein [Stenoxybacter acetivorans]